MSIYDSFSPRELDVLKSRADRLAHNAQDQSNETMITGLVVHEGLETYVLPIEQVLAAYEYVDIVPVPCTPVYVAGIANVRGYVFPVLNLSALLDLEQGREEADSTHMLILTKVDDQSVALKVDAVNGTETFPASAVMPIPANLDITRSMYLKGALADGQVILDISAILKDPALVINDFLG